MSANGSRLFRVGSSRYPRKYVVTSFEAREVDGVEVESLSARDLIAVEEEEVGVAHEVGLGRVHGHFCHACVDDAP